MQGCLGKRARFLNQILLFQKLTAAWSRVAALGLLGVAALAVPAILIPPILLRPGEVLAQSGAPKIWIANPTFDFGTVSQGTVVKHDFVVSNEGDADLVLQRVVPACGCTAVATSGDRIPAKAQGTVSVSFDSTGFSGEKVKTVRIFTNDLDQPSSMLTMKGSVEPDIVVEPSRIFFGDVIRGEAQKSQEVRIKIRPRSGKEVVAVTALSPFLSISENSTTPTERVLSIALDPQAPLGEFRERIVVGVKGDKESTINIPIFAAVKGVVHFEPTMVSLGVLSTQELVERAVKIENLGKQPVKILAIKSSDPAVSARLKEIRTGRSYVLHVAVDPKRIARELKATIEVLTDAKEDPAISLSVYGMLTRVGVDGRRKR